MNHPADYKAFLPNSFYRSWCNNDKTLDQVWFGQVNRAICSELTSCNSIEVCEDLLNDRLLLITSYYYRYGDYGNFKKDLIDTVNFALISNDLTFITNVIRVCSFLNDPDISERARSLASSVLQLDKIKLEFNVSPLYYDFYSEFFDFYNFQDAFFTQNKQKLYSVCMSSIYLFLWSDTLQVEFLEASYRFNQTDFIRAALYLSKSHLGLGGAEWLNSEGLGRFINIHHTYNEQHLEKIDVSNVNKPSFPKINEMTDQFIFPVLLEHMWI